MSDTQTAIILVTDLVGSTEQRSALGEDAAEELRRRHDGTLGEAVDAHDGIVVKSLGDGILARFSGAADAVAAAVAMQQAVDGEFEVRIGISAGDVTLEDGDCFGTPVIEASRLCDHADGGQILIADLARMLARGRGGHVFTPVGELELKGLLDPVGASEVGWERVQAERAPFPAALHQVGNMPFAGRSDTVDVVTSAWKQATAGASGGVLLISGEPGMGKTRLSNELADRVYAEGATVLFGRSDEEVTSAYRTFSEALTPLVEHVPDDDLTAHVEAVAGALGVVVPTLLSRVPDAVVPEGTPDDVRAIVFDAVTDLLIRAARRAPVLLVLDDLHWADDASLLLLRHLARTDEGAVLALGTYRDTDLVRGHQLSSVLADLRRVDGVERVALEGLTLDEVVELMEAAGGHALDDQGRELAGLVHRETEGNPFFVGEILRHLAESGAIYESEGRWISDAASVADLGVPQGIREVVGRRLDSLSDEANQALRAAAVIGQDFDLGVLAGALGRDVDSLLDVLDQALDRNLIAEMPGQIDRIRFPHALVRQTLYEELSASRRVRIHAKVAEAFAASPRSSPSERAHHLIEAAAVAAPEVVAGAAIDAAEEAIGRFAWEAAIGWVERAVEALEDVLPDEPGLHARLLHALGDAHREASDFTRAREVLHEAADLARGAGDTEILSEVVTAFAAAGSVWQDLDDTFGLDLAREVEGMLPPGDSVALARVRVAQLHLSQMLPTAASIESARETVALCRRAAPELLNYALMGQAEAMRGGGDPDELFGAGDAVHRANPRAERWHSYYYMMMARLRAGRFDETVELAHELLEAAKRTRTDIFEWSGRSGLATVHMTRAEWDDAAREVAHCRELAEVLGDTGVTVGYNLAIQLAELRGEHDRVRQLEAELLERFPRWGFYPFAPIVDSRERAVSRAESGQAFADWWTDVRPQIPGWSVPMGVISLAPCIRFVDPAIVEEVRALMAPQAEWFGCAGASSIRGVGHWVLGAAAEASGDLDGAIDHYTAARRAHDAAGEIPIEAWNSVWLVEALRRRGVGGDAERASRVADEIAATAAEHRIAVLGDLVSRSAG